MLHCGIMQQHIDSDEYISLALNARQLTPAHRAVLLEHFLALSRRDAYLRFGGYTGSASIEAYVRGIDFARSTVLGVFDAELRLQGVLHLCPSGGVVELGISVLADARRQGIGTLLLRRALGHARLIGAERLFMHCLAENEDLMRLARAAGAQISFSRDEADGFPVLMPPRRSALSVPRAGVMPGSAAPIAVSTRSRTWTPPLVQAFIH